MHGTPRSGKTHLALKLHALATAQRAFPRIIEGAELGAWLAAQSYRALRQHDEPIVIDDADHYLHNLGAGKSGPWVALIEHLRGTGGTLILTSSRDPQSFDIDDHVRSRLRAGTPAELGMPDEDELRDILAAMARQRGFQFDTRKLEFLYKRLPRHTAELESYLDNLQQLAHTLGKRIEFKVLSDAL